MGVSWVSAGEVAISRDGCGIDHVRIAAVAEWEVAVSMADVVAFNVLELLPVAISHTGPFKVDKTERTT